MEQKRIDSLIAAVKDDRNKLSYLHLKEENGVFSYAGWVSNFGIYRIVDNDNKDPVFLDLYTEKGLFLLFVLASCWSRTGPYENAAYFTLYIKDHWNADITSYSKEFIDEEREDRERAVKTILKEYRNIARKEIAFRPDFYDGVYVLTEKWEEIKESLRESEEKGDYTIFIRFIRSINGLGGHNQEGKMRIKIPLILRELAIAKRYRGIPKEWCCVPDKRVLDACKELEICFDFPDANGRYPLKGIRTLDGQMRQVLKESQIIYSLFGELYDIALFAYQDLFEEDAKNGGSMERKIVGVKVLGVCPNLSHYELDEAYVNCDSERIGLPLLISESGDAQGPMLYSIMIVYQDGSRELMDGIDRSKMMEYLPYIKVE